MFSQTIDRMMDPVAEKRPDIEEVMVNIAHLLGGYINMNKSNENYKNYFDFME